MSASLNSPTHSSSLPHEYEPDIANMRFEKLFASSLCAEVALAFQNTSPFFLFSNSDILGSSNKQIASSHQTHNNVTIQLASCPSDAYVLVSQPGVSVEDFQWKATASSLRRRASGEDESIRSKTIVSEIVGDGLQLSSLHSFLSEKCSASSSKADVEAGFIKAPSSFPHIIEIELPALPQPGQQRAAKLADHDDFINAAIDTLEGRSYTMLYMTTPPSPEVIERLHKYRLAAAEEHIRFDWDGEDASPEALHTDLKRDLNSHVLKRQDYQSDVALFEKYTFFSQGIFMALIVLMILIPIGMVGLNGLSSLEVSYAAFSKEMGPSQQKKQQ